MSTFEKGTRLVLALLQPRTTTGGWVTVAKLVEETGLARSAIYRAMVLLEAGGLVIEHDAEQNGPRKSRGFRCTHELRRRA